MNPPQLQRYFDRISEAPDAIPRLRQFILDLAVRGKLVVQDPSDESASELLKRIVQAKRWLTASKKLKSTKEPAPPLESELPFNIPPGWTATRLGTIYDVRDGTHDTPKYVEAGFPLITSKNLSSGSLTFDPVKFISEQDHRNISERSAVERLDILLAMIGSVGNPVIVDTDRPFSIKNVALFKYYSRDLSSPGFLCSFLKHAAGAMQQLAAGGLQPFVSLGFLRGYPLLLPPLAEQHRIVAKVDELMALCDRLEAAQAERESRRDRLAAASLHRLNQPASTDAPETFREHARFYLNHLPRLTTRPDQIKQIRHTILNLAVRGKLVPQDPSDEPASELLKRIRVDKARLVKNGKIKDSQPLPPIDCDPPFAVPPGWQWERFIEVAAIQSNLVDPKDYRDSPHIAPDNIASGTGKLLPYETIRASAVFSSKHLFFAGCILYSKIRPALAKAVIVDFDGLCSADMYPILPFVDRDYLHRFMLTEAFVQQSVSEDTRVAMPKINQAALSKILVAVAPLAEQRRIVAKVDELMAVCDQLETQLTTARTESRRLLEAVLHEAITPAALQTL
jgi:type I restriction enzyme S subunit